MKTPEFPADVKLSTVNLCTLVAKIEKKQKVTRSADKPTAIKRLTEACLGRFGDRAGKKLLNSILVSGKMSDCEAFIETAFEGAGEEAPATPTDSEGVVKPPKAAKRKREPKAPGEGAERRQSQLLGKTIHPKTDRNVRRAGTHGHKSLSIILANPGLKVEDFLKKGGRLNDLRWDMDKGNVAIK